MRLTRVLLSAVAVAAVAMAGPVAAAPTAHTSGPVVLIMDASGSMNADDGTGRSKIEAARGALHTLVDGLGDDAAVGLRVFGHRTPNTDRETGCQDTELVVPVSTGNADALRQAVDGLRASGFTPIGSSLLAAVEDLPEADDRTVILISDGIDTCTPPAPCDVAQQIIADGVDVRVETVGFQVDAAAAEELRCIAEATGGTYRPADSAEDLARQLRANIPTGIPIEGGPTPALATPVQPGQYVDVLGFPAERWYGIDLDPGDRVRATASVIGGPDTPVRPDVDVELLLAYGDTIGVTSCATDRADGIGPFTHTLAVDGLQVEGGTICGDPGRYAIGLRFTLPQGATSNDRAALQEVELPVELFVAVSSTEVPIEVEPVVQRPVLPPPTPSEPARNATPTSYYLLTVAVFAALGGLLGRLASTKVGP